MGELLRIEWLKVKRYKAFWVFTILYIISVIGINYIGFHINELTKQNVPAAEMLVGKPFGFPKIWGTVGYMSSWLLYFPGILFITLLTNEFSFKTHRQNIIDGWERKDFINVKFVFVFLFSLVATLINALIALIMGMAVKGGAAFSFEGFYNVGFIFIQTFSYISFAMLLAILFRKSGVAIAVFFIYGLILEWLISALINHNLELSPAGYFLPLQVTDSLLPAPFGKQIIYKNVPDNVYLLIGSSVYLVLYYYLAKRKFTREDL